LSENEIDLGLWHKLQRIARAASSRKTRAWSAACKQLQMTWIVKRRLSWALFTF